MRIIRYLLTLLLIFGIYTETGIWTSLFCFLVALETEIRYSPYAC